MSQPGPPRWLQSALRYVLPARDRETIAGDLLEEYREEQAPRLGLVGANLWYLRQLVSLAVTQLSGGLAVKKALVALSLFIVGAGVWLALMENVLRHAGYPARTLVAAGIAVQGVATLVFLLLSGRVIFRVLVMLGAAAFLVLGGSAIVRVLRAPHFEGFVLLIGLALVVQGALTLFLATRQAAPATLDREA
ncbi:MAG: hypothetical protein ACYC6M_06245 [Terriglobales bacterium]